ncbi:MAG TPA: AMP-binding protein, partial [Ramlibacter sp.]|nr:AMP-binding protein [Ramlibacter sp.]
MYLTQGLQRSLQRHPGKTALVHVDEQGERSHSFAQLIAGIARQAASLADRGLGQGDRIALLAPNSDRLVQAIMACWWLGAVACPLNTRWSAPELAHALEDSGASLFLVDPSLAHAAVDTAVPRLPLDEFVKHADSFPPMADTRTGGDALAAILYTGGTTGRAKGVMLSHANFWT